jgi:outer membrane protein, heavy metal efflux system
MIRPWQGQGQVPASLLSTVVALAAVVGEGSAAAQHSRRTAHKAKPEPTRTAQRKPTDRSPQSDRGLTRRTYTLAAALKRFKRRAPAVVAARRRARGLRSASGLAARFTNPSLDYDQELVFPLATQEVVSLRLPVPLGGRLTRARDVARRQARLATARVEQLLASGGVGFAKKYFGLLQLHRLRKLRQKSLVEHRDLAKRMAARAKGGGIAGIIATRLELEVRRRGFALERLRERLDRLGRTLALAIGDRRAILVPSGVLLPPASPPPLQSLGAKLRVSSTQRLLRLTLDVRRAQERLARARRWPDLGLSLGYMRQQSPQPDRRVSHGLVFGLSVPLPFFSSNKRAVRIAQLRGQSAAWKVKVRRQNDRVLLHDAHGRAARARKRCARYLARVVKRLPALLRGVRVAFDGGGALSGLLESLAAVDTMREGGLKLALEARLQTLRLHELAGTLPNR